MSFRLIAFENETAAIFPRMSRNAYPRQNSVTSGHRFYDPKAGRWLSKDPIEEQGGINLYAWCGNDGVGVFDLLGKIPASMIHIFYISNAGKKVELENGDDAETKVKDFQLTPAEDVSGGLHKIFLRKVETQMNQIGLNGTEPIKKDQVCDVQIQYTILLNSRSLERPEIAGVSAEHNVQEHNGVAGAAHIIVLSGPNPGPGLLGSHERGHMVIFVKDVLALKQSMQEFSIDVISYALGKKEIEYKIQGKIDDFWTSRLKESQDGANEAQRKFYTEAGWTVSKRNGRALYDYKAVLSQ